MEFLKVSSLFFLVILGNLNNSLGYSIVENTMAESCGTENSNVYSFTIPANSPNGPITLFHIQYDASSALPITSTAFHDSMNLEQLVEREDNFKIWDCPQLPIPDVQADCTKTFKMTEEQADVSGYTSYDRGHLSPVNPYRFHFTAMDNTFYCVNNAPQEPFTNQQPWNVLEQTVLRSIPGGLIITGTCAEKASEGPTLDAVTVPDCYFKLACYIDEDSETTEVVGFIGENALFDRYDTGATESRRSATVQPRSQSQVIQRTGRSSYIQSAWRAGHEELLGNRERQLAPNPEDCIRKTAISDDVVEQWEDWIEEHTRLLNI